MELPSRTRVEWDRHHRIVRDAPRRAWYFLLGDRFLMGVKDRRADLEKNMAETLQRLKVASESRDSST
ncbi:MAG: hypothetical protein M3Q30_10245 [Actinomycetota bacterium]|nr:hypothetical protein [Actinomycetota bacterium]